MRCQTYGRVWEWMPSNLLQSSTFSICLIILGIFLARHYLEEFNRIKGLLFKPKKGLIFCQKMSCLALEGQRTAMIFLCFSGHVNTWAFRQLKIISVHLHCQFGSHHIIPGSCALNYLHSCPLKLSGVIFEGKKPCLSQTGWMNPGTSPISRMVPGHCFCPAEFRFSSRATPSHRPTVIQTLRIML